jgi:hypothetical protein
MCSAPQPRRQSGTTQSLVARGAAADTGRIPHSAVDDARAQEDDKALHKCVQEEHKFERLRGSLPEEQRPTGFSSAITVGSMLPFKTSIMKGSVVELLARRCVLAWVV